MIQNSPDLKPFNNFKIPRTSWYQTKQANEDSLIYLNGCLRSIETPLSICFDNLVDEQTPPSNSRIVVSKEDFALLIQSIHMSTLDSTYKQMRNSIPT